jgi:DNA repair protein RecN (Recombination protein N)
MARKWWTLIAVCVATFMLLLDITIVNVALPSIQSDLDASLSSLQWVVDAYALTLASFLLVFGSLGDRLGRRRIFSIGFGVFTLASLLCGLSNDPTVLNFFRALQGVGGAAMFATSLALIAQEFEGRERAQAIGIWGATVGGAVAVGPLVGGALTDAFGWEWIFFVNVPIGIAAIILTETRVANVKATDVQPIDWAGLVTFSLSLFALIFGLIRGNPEGWGSAQIVAALGAAVVLLVAFVAIEMRRTHAMLDLRLFRVPAFGGVSIVAWALSAGMFAMFLYITLYVQDVLGFGPLDAGVRFLPVTLLSFFVAPIAGNLLNRIQARFMLGIGLIVVGVGLVLMHGVAVGDSWTTLLPGFLVAGVGIGMTNPAIASTALAVVPPARAGMASGINSTFRQIGIATGVAALGAVLSAVLRELRIENLLLIERAELRLGPGLNVVTGETGAGKTILAHSLDLLLGGRARSQIVRPGAGEAYVEGVFDLPNGVLDDPELAELAERLPEDAEEVVLARRVSASGRTSAFVGGRSASASDLRALGGRLLAFYGQHEHRRLALAAAQLEILDRFAGPAHLERLAAYRRAHGEVAGLARELAELRDREGARERDLDLYRFELAEIEALAPDPDEARALRAERERRRHAERLRVAAATTLGVLAGEADGGAGTEGAAGLGAAASAALDGAGGIDPGLDEIAARVAALEIEIGDLASSLRAFLDSIDAEPGRLEAVEERLAALDRLERKHGGSAESVLDHAERLRERIARLENSAEVAAGLEARLAEASEHRAALAHRLTSRRRRAGGELAPRVAEELAQLAMEGATLEARLEPEPEGFGPHGAERAELAIATNPGIPPSPLRDAASGGELSRVMLALSAVAGPAAEGSVPTVVFDEIDAGIGGRAARAVGARLRALGEGIQVLCITHLPRVASLASKHFVVAKAVRAGQSLATVETVDGDAVVDELCRMLGAEAGDEGATRHAHELLAAAA